MSFIGEVKKGVTYTPGWFLAKQDESCTRETKEIAQSGAVTTESGKYVPMGTPYPSNDGNCIGIVYEDVDVTTGNMPGSVVTKGEVYEDRIPIQSVAYNSVSPVGTENPSEEGWYEKDGDVYTLSTDTTVDNQKTYYEKVETRLASAAKSALAALGFKFTATAPAVTRPY